MARQPKLSASVIESVSRVLADTASGFSGSELGKLLNQTQIPDIEPTNTKWKRLYAALINKQQNDDCSNIILNFIQNALDPVRHYNDPEWFANTRFEINKILSFAGYNIGENGKISAVSKTTTISEAAARASRLKEQLISRKVHPDVIKYCREELLVDNYFHAVFEATKSVADKIRIKTGLTSDGAALVDEAFAFSKIPHLALNSLTDESQQSEQKGFMNLLKGLFGTFRNVTAHAPKIAWKIDEIDALDILSLASLVHRRLDLAIEARKIYENKI